MRNFKVQALAFLEKEIAKREEERESLKEWSLGNDEYEALAEARSEFLTHEIVILKGLLIKVNKSSNYYM